ncbi:MAG: hypothetical protein H0X05_06980 [Actinobacteria bacterium]|nr:hypothetical protein [Actinomycetota bacterium]
MVDATRAVDVIVAEDRQATPEERSAIEEIVVIRDVAAFARGDWSSVEADFDAAAFVGYAGSNDPRETWHVGFPTLALYRDEWLRQADDMRALGPPEQIVRELRGACEVTEVRVNGDRAVARKRFDGVAFGQVLLWETYYLLRRDGDRWLITGFVGYLPASTPR